MNFQDMIHHSKEYESAVIGVSLFEPDKIIDIMQYLQSSDVFYWDENKLAYEAILELSSKQIPIDILTLTDKLTKVTHPSGERWGYTLALKMQNVVSSAHLQYWCLRLIEMYIKREQIKFQTSISLIDDPLEATQELDKSIKKALNFKNIVDWTNLSTAMLTLENRRKEIANGAIFGVNTGFKQFDDITGGLQTGLHVICARPGMGKTAFALSVILNMIQRGVCVGLISLEMPNVQLVARILSAVTGIPFWKIFKNINDTPQMEMDVDNAMRSLSGLPLYITDSSTLTPDDIYAKAEKLVRNKGAKVIFIDYLQLIDIKSEKNKQRYELVGQLSRGLKVLSKKLDIPIVPLAQLNRESESSDKVSKMGKVSQLRESGSIEQDMDMGIVIDRPYKRGLTAKEDGTSTINQAFISVQKHRNGEEKDIEIEFIPETMRFKDLHTEPPQHESYKISRDLSKPLDIDIPY